MFTDPNRKLRTDKGNPDICPVFAYHKIFNKKERQAFIDAGCRSAEWGCVDCKKELAELVVAFFREFHARREALLKDRGQVESVLYSGAEEAGCRSWAAE